MTAITSAQKGLLFGCLGAFSTAFYIVFFKKAAGFAEPAQMAVLLFGFSLIFQMIFLVATGGLKHLTKVTKPELYCAFAMAFGAITGNLTSALALKTMSAPLVTAFVRFEVIFVSLVGFFLMKERLSWWFAAGVAIVGTGMATTLPQSALGTTNYEGVGYSLLSACCFGLVTLSARYFRKGIDIVKVNTLRMVICFGFMLGVTDLSFAKEGTWQPWYSYIAICAFAGPFLARLFKMASSRFVQAGYTALTALLQPFFAFAIAMAVIPLFVPEWREVIGCLIMVAGIFVAMRPKLSRSH